MNLTVKLTEITPTQLLYVCEVIIIKELPPFQPEHKRYLWSYYSILQDLQCKLTKKYFAMKTKKRFTLTLKYHEANTLYEVLNAVGYEQEAQPLFDKLHQKLT